MQGNKANTKRVATHYFTAVRVIVIVVVVVLLLLLIIIVIIIILRVIRVKVNYYFTLYKASSLNLKII